MESKDEFEKRVESFLKDLQTLTDVAVTNVSAGGIISTDPSINYRSIDLSFADGSTIAIGMDQKSKTAIIDYFIKGDEK